jgi:serine/threonine-protein kinase RsbW
VGAVITHGDLRVTVADNAPAFNPLTVSTPNLEEPLGERAVGGLGIHLVRTLMDDVRYRRQNGRNHVRLRKKLG